jgi:hypothetical protein
MSALGQKATSAQAQSMSAMGQKRTQAATLHILSPKTAHFGLFRFHELVN